MRPLFLRRRRAIHQALAGNVLAQKVEKTPDCRRHSPARRKHGVHHTRPRRPRGQHRHQAAIGQFLVAHVVRQYADAGALDYRELEGEHVICGVSRLVHELVFAALRSAQSLGFRLGLDAKELTDAQRHENAMSERLVSQFLAADVVVIGAPMYNFSVPSLLKTWIDRVAQAGRTFTYTEKGPQGLAGGKTVIVESSRGGVYSTNPALAGLDHQESYLKTVFFGIADVQFVRAEGIAMGDAAKAQALSGGRRRDQGAGQGTREPGGSGTRGLINSRPGEPAAAPTE